MFKITRGGTQARHNAPFKMDRPRGNIAYLLLFVKTRATFNIDGHVFSVFPGTLILIPPHIPYSYVSDDKVYIDDWMHFECSRDEMAPFPAAFFCKPLPINNSAPLLAYIKQSVWEFLYSPEPLKSENIDLLMHILFNHILSIIRDSRLTSPSVPYENKLRDLRMELYSNPCEPVTAEVCAKRLKISLSYFQHLYTKLFGVSFKEDLILLRLRYAKDLLSETSYPIETIAYQSGYNNPVHFYRQFKAKEGLTPLAYRKINSLYSY